MKAKAQRTRLPNRRPHWTETIEWRGREWSMGYCLEDGKVLEVFLKGEKTGTDYEGLLNHGCVMMSYLFRMGMRASELAEPLGRDSTEGNRESASPLGLVARRLAEIESETNSNP